MKKLLLTGASGFLGWNISKQAEGNWEIYGTTHTSSSIFPGAITHRVNLADEADLKKLFGEIKPDAVIHTAAISDANSCQQNPNESFSINVTATVLLVKLCEEGKIPFVFTSSDLVFDGKKGNYTESDAVNPLSKYGEQKAEAERLILKIYPEAAICRMPLMVGDGGPKGKGYLNSFLQKASSGEKLQLFTDEFRSPLGGASAARSLLHAMKNFKGLYHLGGRERLSRFELGQKIAEAFGIPLPQLFPAKQSELKMSAPRPADVSLDSSKACQNGFEPLKFFDELLLLATTPTSDIQFPIS